MSLRYYEILTLLEEIKPHIVKCKLLNIEELSPTQWILTFGEPEAPYHLFFSFLVPFVRFHHTNKQGKTPHHPFLLALINALQGASLEKASLLNEDRILCLAFRKKATTYSLIAELFAKFPNCVLLNEEEDIVASLFPTERTHYMPPPKNIFLPSTEPPEKITSAQIEQHYIQKEAEHRFAKEKNVADQTIKSRLNKCIKRHHYLQKLLAKNQSWEELHHQALLLQSNLYHIKKGMTSIEVNDWLTQETRLLPLESHIDPVQQIADLFKRSRKLKLGLPHMERQIEKNNLEEEHWKKLQEKITPIQTINELHEFCREEKIPTPSKHLAKKEEKKPKLPYKLFYTQSGLKIWVGRDAKANDKLTFQLANGRDWWFHVSGCSGSHVILRLESQRDPDENAVLDAMQLAMAYSKLKNESHADIIVTQKKYLQRADKNRPGEVIVSKHKIRQISLDHRRLQQIKQRRKERY